MSAPDDNYTERAIYDSYRATALEAALKVFSTHAATSRADGDAGSILKDAQKFLGFLKGENAQ